jgi:exopolyphosphatase/guanosine-5'-triphosphate,3'-diphosphate pyrophosphatase
LSNPQTFLLPAETALGHPIEVVSGREEARLIYQGVAHGLPMNDDTRLVIDIGGSSTEFIIGQRYEALERESLQVGCIASSLRFFEDGRSPRSGGSGHKRKSAWNFSSLSPIIASADGPRR